jgi:protein involved in polysaccharide export with SLBB domain
MTTSRSTCRLGTVLLAGVLLGLAGCTHHQPALSSGVLPPALLPPTPFAAGDDYRLQRGDEIDVKFLYQPEENQHVAIRPDGRISLPATGDLTVTGMTPNEIQKLIQERSGTHLRNPEVVIVVTHVGEQRVYIGGEVVRPGYVPLRPDMTPLQAVLQSGGFKRTAKLESVLLLTPDADGRFNAARVDMKQVVNDGVPERVRLHPDDVVFVPQTWIGGMDDVVDLWVRGLIPVIPRVGVGYSL